jgi:DNA polymerase-1
MQGTAADIIKRAMIDVHQWLGGADTPARLVMQVHDELVLEVPEGEVDAVRQLVREAMEGVWPLKVPLRVDVHDGADWAAAH